MLQERLHASDPDVKKALPLFKSSERVPMTTLLLNVPCPNVPGYGLQLLCSCYQPETNDEDGHNGLKLDIERHRRCCPGVLQAVKRGEFMC